MKILMTGCTALQIGNDNRVGSITKIDVPASIVQALRERGHTVDWKKVTPGDDLSSYDAAWINLAPINSLNGRAGAMGALWTLSSPLPAVAFADDWQINAVWNGMRAMVRRPKMLTKYMLTGAGVDGRGEEDATHWSKESIDAATARILEKNPTARIGCERYYMRDTDEQVLPHAERLVQAASDFVLRRWERGMQLVCPMYSWGDHTLIEKRLPEPARDFLYIDPSSTIYPLIAPHVPFLPQEKEREWILGALMPHDDWVNKREWDWPVNYMGSKTVVRRYGGQRVKTEDDVLEVYNGYWGILSPPYPHAGSGWWRSRFMYAAKVRSVLCCDRGEGAPLGPAYEWKHQDIEKLDQDALVMLADEQAAALRPHMPTYESFVDACEHAIMRAFLNDKGGAQDSEISG